MQPNQQNYWGSGNSGADKDNASNITEMYAPQPDDEANQNATISGAKVDKPAEDSEPVHWSATEYIHQEKNGLWFVMFFIVVLAFIAADIFFLKSYTFSALVVVMAMAIIIYSRRPPRVVDYTLSGSQGLYIGDNLHHFSEFKAFGLIKDKDHHSIMLIPVKRFMPGVSVYFPDEVGEKIVDILGARLPMKQMKLDTVDLIIRKLRL